MSNLDVGLLGNNLAYACDIFHYYISHYEFPDGDLKYYYQYEFDSSQTIYERMMGGHCISIAARSLGEANIINVILHCIIDGHTGAIQEYIDDDDNDDDDTIILSDKEFFTKIYNSKDISNYSDYVSDCAKDIRCNEIHIGNDYRTQKKFHMILNSITVFDKDNILMLLKDECTRTYCKYKETEKYFTDVIYRLNYILEYVSRGG